MTMTDDSGGGVHRLNAVRTPTGNGMDNHCDDRSDRRKADVNKGPKWQVNKRLIRCLRAIGRQKEPRAIGRPPIRNRLLR